MAKKTTDKFILDPNWVSHTPTKVLTAEHGNVRIVTKLYGTVTPERLVQEERIIKHRADQLDPPKLRVVIERPVREEEPIDGEDW